MTALHFRALAPLLGLGGAIVVVMLAISIGRSRGVTALLAILGLAVSLGMVAVASDVAPADVTPLLRIDGYALFYFILLMGASAIVTALSQSYLEDRNHHSDEFYLLLLLATLGTCTMAASTHFVSLFLGLELLSVSLYAMIAYFKRGEKSLEAGIKYLILAAASSAFLLFGMALLYARTGSLAFADMGSALKALEGGPDVVALAGLGMLFVGVGFKLALVPFHLWTPDVYEGAPAPVTAYVATASKGAMIALLVRFAVMTGAQLMGQVVLLFSILAVASMITGNVLALLQNNVKRLLAYSSIAHLGYVIVAFLAGGPRGTEAVGFYLIAYFVTMLGAFAVITLLSGKDRDLDRIEDYEGMGKRHPFLAAIFTAMLLSLAGIPLTAGFVGKFLVLSSGVDRSLWVLVLMMVFGSVVSIYYYLRVIVAMYLKPVPDESAEPGTSSQSLSSLLTLGALAVALLWLGVWPALCLEMIRSLTFSLF